MYANVRRPGSDIVPALTQPAVPAHGSACYCTSPYQPALSELGAHAVAGEWFCCSQCGHIRDQLTQQVGKGPIPMEDELSWQVLRGVDGTDASADALAKATALLQVSTFCCAS